MLEALIENIDHNLIHLSILSLDGKINGKQL